LGVALILLELANKLDWLTGGTDGIQGLVFSPVLGKFEFDLAGPHGGLLLAAVLLALFLVARRIVHSPFGATLKAIRDNRLRAMAIGVPVHARLVAVYTIAAAMAGAAGRCSRRPPASRPSTCSSSTAPPTSMLMLVIGGVGWLYGGVPAPSCSS
jgi:branched-chain amino acid transport system permease protein